MAMSRSLGETSLTTRSPMEMIPLETSSRPAIILRAVVLPQPEGPTRTRNSLSLISIERSLTAVTLPNCFVTWSKTTLAIPSSLSLDCSSREARDVVLHEERVDDSHRDRPKQRRCHQRPPLIDVRFDQIIHGPHGYGLHGARRHEYQSVEELVPG